MAPIDVSLPCVIRSQRHRNVALIVDNEALQILLANFAVDRRIEQRSGVRDTELSRRLRLKLHQSKFASLAPRAGIAAALLMDQGVNNLIGDQVLLAYFESVCHVFPSYW